MKRILTVENFNSLPFDESYRMRSAAEYLAQAHRVEGVGEASSDCLQTAYLKIAKSYRKLARERERFTAKNSEPKGRV
jgi:hypothetical protein